MTDFATQLIALVAQIADAAECEFWQCHQLPAGQHHESCLTAAAEPDEMAASLRRDGFGADEITAMLHAAP